MTSPSPDTGPTQNPDQWRKWIVIAALLALILKLAIASSTFGSNDVESFYHFGRTLSQYGLQWTYTRDQFNPVVTHDGLQWIYSHTTAFNHPPLVAYYLRFIYRVGHLPFFEQNNIAFPLLLRVPGIIADLVVVLLLMRHQTQLRLPSWALVVFALSPVSLMVAGYHGNTDSIMVMFLVIAALMCLRKAPILCGVALALSCQIKIIPALLFPIFACFWFARRQSFRFLLPFAATTVLLCVEALLRYPGVLVKNVISYGSLWGHWGITYLLRLTGRPEFSVDSFYDLPKAEVMVMTGLKLFVIGCVLVIAWRRQQLGGHRFFETIGVTWIVFFVFSPAIVPQYMVWLAPFVLVLSPVLSVALLAASSLFLFCFYNVTSQGLPWYIAISTPMTSHSTSPWGLWPWAVLILWLAVLWRQARKTHANLRLFSFDQVRPAPST